MTRKLFFVLVGILIFSACATPKSNTIEVSNAWVRSGVKDGTSAVYMLILNETSQDHELIGVTTDIVVASEMHLSEVHSDVMTMTRQEVIEIPADGELELKPGGYHIMLIGLNKDLNLGDEITVTLHFQNYQDVVLNVPVLDAAEMGGEGMDGHHHP